MKEFKDRQGSNLKNKVFKVDSVVRNASGEIEEIYGKLIRNDSEGLTESGTELNATNLTEIIKDLIEKEIDTNKCMEVANKINIPTQLTSNYTVALPETNDELISITLLRGDNVIANNQISVTQGLVNENITIVAKVTKRNATYEKVFNIEVEAREMTDEERVEADLESLEVPSQVENNFTLDTTVYNGATINWTSSDSSVISINGGNAIVYQDTVDITVNLLAEVVLENCTKTKTFSVTVKAKEMIDEERVEADLNSLTVPSQVEDNFTLRTTGINGTSISWTSNNSSVISISGRNANVYRDTVDRNVVLTATVSLGSYSDTKTFSVTVKAEVIQVTYQLNKEFTMWGINDTSLKDDTIEINFNNGNGYVNVSSIPAHLNLNITGNNTNNVIIHINELAKPDFDVTLDTMFSIEISIYDENNNHLGNENYWVYYEED